MSETTTGSRNFLLDTNVVNGILNGHQPAADLVEFHGAVPGRCAISQITRMELLGFSSLSSEDEAAVVNALAGVAVLAVDAAIEAEAIHVRRRTRLKLPDAIILATARIHGLRLLTLDDKLQVCFETLPEQ